MLIQLHTTHSILSNYHWTVSKTLKLKLKLKCKQSSNNGTKHPLNGAQDGPYALLSQAVPTFDAESKSVCKPEVCWWCDYSGLFTRSLTFLSTFKFNTVPVAFVCASPLRQ